jgi:tetratricopeptide (TPR) repeat protein
MPAARHEARALAGWWVAAAGIGAVTLYARIASAGHFEGTPALPGDAALPMLATAARAVLHYLAITVWPASVAIVYGPSDLWTPPGLAAVLALGLTTLLLIPATRHALLAWGGAGLLALLPFLTVFDSGFQPQDRYAVLWLAVAAAGAGIGLARLAGRHPIVLPAAAAAAVALAFNYRDALFAWRDTAALQAVIDRQNASHPDPRRNYARPAMVAWLLGDPAETARRLREGRARFPDSAALRETAAQLATLDARWRERVGSTTSITPLALLHYDLGRSWLRQGEPQAAAAHFARALTLAPALATARLADATAATPSAP